MKIKITRNVKWSIKYKTVEFKSGEEHASSEDFPLEIANKMINYGYAVAIDESETETEGDDESETEGDGEGKNEGEGDGEEEMNDVREEIHGGEYVEVRQKQQNVPENKAILKTPENKSKKKTKKKGPKPKNK